MASPPKSGVRNLAGIKWAEYGPKVGAYRLMRIANKYAIPAVFCINARVAELFPEVIREISASKFEIAGHNYAQDEVLSGLSLEEEMQLINTSLKKLEDLSGVRPKGWVSATLATTENTLKILDGEKLLWHGDYNNIDLPFVLEGVKSKMVAIPHSDFADNRVLNGSPFDLFTTYQNTFDFLHQEEPNSYLNIVIHCHFGGRPLISAVFDKVLKYIKQFPDVWFPTHEELSNRIIERNIKEINSIDRFK
jgi:peptidoglycan/xylan/chitin deacetylase (PgdA/CDA1 family)